MGKCDTKCSKGSVVEVVRIPGIRRRTMIKIKIDTGNSAFDGDQRDYEIARILRQMADDIEECHAFGIIRDINGNIVGTVEYIGKDRC